MNSLNLFFAFLIVFNARSTSAQDSIASMVNQTIQKAHPASSTSDTTRNEKQITIQHLTIDSIRWSPNARIISEPQPLYKTVIDVLSALITPLIALITFYIALQQHRINKLHYQNELYDKRFKIYTALRQFIGSAIQRGGVIDDELPIFIRGTSESSFLFGDDVTKYLNEVYLKGVDYNYVYNFLHPNSSSSTEEERAKNINKGYELITWFSAQFERSDRLFRTYMKIVE